VDARWTSRSGGARHCTCCRRSSHTRYGKDCRRLSRSWLSLRARLAPGRLTRRAKPAHAQASRAFVGDTEQRAGARPKFAAATSRVWSEAIRALVPADSRWIRVAYRERAGGDSNMVVERRGEGNPVRALAAPLAAPQWSPDPRTPARATCTHGRGRHPRPRGHTPQGHGHDPAHRQAVPEQQPPSQIAVVGGRQSPTRRTRRPSLLRVVGLASAGASTVAPWRRRPDRAGT